MNKLSYVLVLLSASTMNAVNGFIYPILSVHIINIGGTNTHVGLNFALPMLVNVIMYFGWGLFSDYIGRRKPLIMMGSVIGAIVFFEFPYLDVNQLLGARALQAVFFSTTVLVSAIMTEYFPNNKGLSMGYLNIGWGAGYAIGAFASGTILRFGLEFSFGLCAIVSIISGLILIPTIEPSKEREKVNISNIFVFGERKQIAVLSVSAFVLLTGNWIIFSVFPVYLYSIMEGAGYSDTMSINILGIAAGFSALTGTVAAYYAGEICDTHGRKSMLLFASFAYLAVWSAFVLTDNILVIILLWTMPVWIYFNISSTSMVSDLTKEYERGRGIGLLNTSVGLGNVVGAILGGLIADAFSFKVVFLTTCVFTLCAIVLIGFTKETLPVRIEIKVDEKRNLKKSVP